MTDCVTRLFGILAPLDRRHHYRRCPTRSSSLSYIDDENGFASSPEKQVIHPASCQPRRAYRPSRDRSCGNLHSNPSNDCKTMQSMRSSKRRRPAHAHLHHTRLPRRPSRIFGSRRSVKRGKELIGEIRHSRGNTHDCRVHRGLSTRPIISGITPRPEGISLPAVPTRARLPLETNLGSPLVSDHPSTRAFVVLQPSPTWASDPRETSPVMAPGKSIRKSIGMSRSPCEL